MNIEDIEIRRFKFEIVKYYKKDGTLLGLLYNEHEFNLLRIELVKNNLTQECYFMWKDIKITLSEDGDMSSFPRGLYDHLQIALCELFKLGQKI